MGKQSIITLLTDFGWSDPYVAVMKGAIFTILPDAHLVDIGHDIPPGDVLGGAYALGQALPYFPPETVHCVVIDPTVGSQRRVLAARYAGQFVVFPDNGVITIVNQDQPLEQIVLVQDERYFLSPLVSTTFHGRDIIAPVAARIASGLPLSRLGPPPDTMELLELPGMELGADGVVSGKIVHVDRFGNLITNLPEAFLAGTFGSLSACQVTCAGRGVGPILRTYSSVPPGAPLALINSANLLEIAVNAGSATVDLGADVGDDVQVRRAEPGSQE
ncbi:MAG TPA: SAM-dependent chlorinase/fluorinase [Phycisphaerae bacterium]|nr:SAM-dependent chlorinase/fluorinase [Phycisphaerae bacterium]